MPVNPLGICMCRKKIVILQMICVFIELAYYAISETKL